MRFESDTGWRRGGGRPREEFLSFVLVGGLILPRDFCDRVAAAVAMKARDEGVKRPERYEGVEEYDPVLQWHCRL